MNINIVKNQNTVLITCKRNINVSNEIIIYFDENFKPFKTLISSNKERMRLIKESLELFGETIENITKRQGIIEMNGKTYIDISMMLILYKDLEDINEKMKKEHEHRRTP